MKRIALALLAIPALYLFAALIGGLVPLNRGWQEPHDGIAIYIADNGIHADLILPVIEENLNWEDVIPSAPFQEKPGNAQWLAFGAGERRIYLETPTWADVRPGTVSHALTGGERVMHVQWVSDPRYSARELRVTPEEYRRLWAAIRAGFRLDSQGRAIAIAHPGYWRSDAFFEGVGKTSAVHTCNHWVASRLRIAGVKTALWAPFTQGLLWRYRKVDQST